MPIARVRYLEHKEKSILYTDLSGLVESEVLPTLVESARMIRSHPPESLLTLTDVRSTHLKLRTEDGAYDRATAESIRNCVVGNRPHVKASAIVLGQDESTRVIIEFFNRISERHFEMFDSIEVALDWLVTR